MTSLNGLVVAVTVLLCLTSSENITLEEPAEEETSPTVTETVREATETSLERFDDCEEDEWSCHQKGKKMLHSLCHCPPAALPSAGTN